MWLDTFKMCGGTYLRRLLGVQCTLCLLAVLAATHAEDTDLKAGDPPNRNCDTSNSTCPDTQLDKRLKAGIVAGVVCFVFLLVIWVGFMWFLYKHGYICKNNKQNPESCDNHVTSSTPETSRDSRNVSRDPKMQTLDVQDLQMAEKSDWGANSSAGFANPCYEHQDEVRHPQNNVFLKTSESPCVS